MNTRASVNRALLAALGTWATVSMSGCTTASATPPVAVSPAPSPSPGPAPENDLLAYTCADYVEALELANAGEKPTAERQAQALDAQDDLVDAMMWLHGYQTGRNGPDIPAAPLTRSWMVASVGKLADACVANSPDGTLPLANAVAKL